MTTTPQWMPSASILASYVDQNGSLPRQSGAADDDERRAGNVLRRLRRLLASGELESELGRWLDENVTGWREDNVRPAARGLRGPRPFEARVRALKAFVARHGRFPSASGTAHNEAELGVFLRNLRQAAQGRGTTSFTASKRLRLDRMTPGWDRGVLPLTSFRGHMAPAVGH